MMSNINLVPEILENGNRSYTKNHRRCGIERNKIVYLKEEEALAKGIDVEHRYVEFILYIIPLSINYFVNKETGQSYLRLRYKDKTNQIKTKDFEDMTRLQDYIGRRGFTAGTGTYWKEYLNTLSSYSNTIEFFPEGISYNNGKYEYIDENENVVTNPEFNTSAVERGIKQLKHHEEISNIKNKRKFRTIMKWGLVSKFFFAMKDDELRRDDDMIPYLFLTGQAKTGKTAILSLVSSIYKERAKASQSVKTQFTMLKTMGLSKNPLVIEEGLSLFNNTNSEFLIDTLKTNASSSKEIGARGMQTQDINEYYGLRCVGFTMNDQPIITDPGMRRRMINLVFLPEDTTTETNKTKYRRLKGEGFYVEHLRELYFYLQMKIIEELNNSKEGFMDCVDKILKEEGLEEFTDCEWSIDVETATRKEEELIEQEVYSLINNELARSNNIRKDVLLKDGYITGVIENEGDYYATSTFINWYNNNSLKKLRISLRKFAGIVYGEGRSPTTININGKRTACVKLNKSNIMSLGYEEEFEEDE